MITNNAAVSKMTFIKKVGRPRSLFNDVNENAEKKKTKTSCGFHSS